VLFSASHLKFNFNLGFTAEKRRGVGDCQLTRGHWKTTIVASTVNDDDEVLAERQTRDETDVFFGVNSSQIQVWW
jgi:hypothetical protein